MDGQRVAVCQVPDLQGSVSGAVKMIRGCAREAATAGAEVVCLPEGYLGGYTRDRATAHARALDLESTAFRVILRDLESCSPWLVFGLIERDGVRLFSTAVVVKGGELIGCYRKRHPHEPAFTPGNEAPVFDTGSLRFGIGICSDARDPADAAHYASRRVDAMLYPLNNMLPTAIADRWRSRHLEILIERARQTGAWVLSADVIGTHSGARAYGCTAAIDPAGSVRGQITESHAGTLVIPLK